MHGHACKSDHSFEGGMVWAQVLLNASFNVVKLVPMLVLQSVADCLLLLAANAAEQKLPVHGHDCIEPGFPVTSGHICCTNPQS